LGHIKKADAIRPYVDGGRDDFDDAVDVVGHDDEFMRSNIWAHGFGFEPCGMGNLADGVQ
jgi:hypothetical protein